MRGVAWNDSKIALLKRLWGQGETASAIGKKLGGISRAAVLGKIHRLRLDAKPLSRRRGKPAEAERPSAGTGPRILFELTNECCRWPYERPGKPFLFCADAGADVINGIPYCPRHMGRAYIVAPPAKPERRAAARFAKIKRQAAA